MPDSRFSIREASTHLDDANLLVAIFDSTIPFLETTGNGEQWGNVLFSAKEGFLQSTQDDVAQSERYARTGEGEAKRVFIAEIEDEQGDANTSNLARRHDEGGRTYLPVASVMIRDNHFAQHIRDNQCLKEWTSTAIAEQSFIYLDVLIVDFRTGQGRTGAGAALVEHVKEYAKARGHKAIYVDCWVGGTQKLLRYVVTKSSHDRPSYCLFLVCLLILNT